MSNGNKPIPTALLSLLEFESLSDSEKANFGFRLDYIAEIADKLKAVPNSEAADWKDIVDDIELDVVVNLGIPRDGSAESSWTVHTSWTFGLRAHNLRTALGGPLIARIEKGIPSSASQFAQFPDWLIERGDTLHELLGRLYSAATATGAVALLLAIDVVLAQLLLGAYGARLNEQIPI